MPGLPFGDETVKVIVNTRGEIGEISEDLKEVIRYLNDGTVTGQYKQVIRVLFNCMFNRLFGM